MRAWVVSEITQNGAMALRDVAKPSVAADQCLVRVEAAGVACRFTAPVYPGESIACAFWRTGSAWTFRASVVNRVVALVGLSETIEQSDRA